MNKKRNVLSLIFLGKRYSTLKSISDQARYMTMNAIFMVAIIPLTLIGISLIGADLRYIIDFSLAFVLLVCLVLLRSKVPFKIIPFIPSILFGAYCLYLLYVGALDLWTAVWALTYPLIAIFLCKMTAGLILSSLVFVVSILFLYTPLAPVNPDNQVEIRFIVAYALILILTIIYERVSILKDRKEAALNAELAHQRDVVQTMKDNINQGIFLMDTELKILSQYSRPLISILSFYDSELSGKSFLDILAASLDAKQLQNMKDYFAMIFSKSRSTKVLESANPISEFEYRINGRSKTLSARFHLIEQTNSAPFIIGIIQDITREKEFEKELRAQKEEQELEMKNLFDVIQIDPLVFHDFMEDIESNFNYINEILKDKSLTGRQVVTKFFQNIHAVKSNAQILGLENFGQKLHSLEDHVKAVSAHSEIRADDILGLAAELEALMEEKDTYLTIVKKIEAFKASNQVDSVLIHSMAKAVEKISEETQKKVELKVGQLDMGILESKLRKPIKDILFQCVRNSIYHGIEPAAERVRKSKKPQGLLSFAIKKIDGRVEVTFSDDGRGLDWEKIKKKYQEKFPQVQPVTKKNLLASIFSPQFTTSEETTLFAGRGVGLSLVKDLVKEYNGAIQVDSSEAGLTLRFSFPLTS